MLTRRHLLQVGALGLAGAPRNVHRRRDLAWTNVLVALKIKVAEFKPRR
jgi:hypothetical protein